MVLVDGDDGRAEILVGFRQESGFCWMSDVL